MSAITLTHTPADGTLADGTSRGDTAGTVLKANRFRFSRNLGMWYLPHSRDKSANTALIERTAAALREAGHSVEPPSTTTRPAPSPKRRPSAPSASPVTPTTPPPAPTPAPGRDTRCSM